MNHQELQEDLLRAPSAAELAQLHSWTHTWLQRLVDAILQPTTFLAAIVWLFGGSYMDVGVIASAAGISYALGSVVMPFALAQVEDIRLVLLGANVVRAIASAIIAFVGWRAGEISNQSLIVWLVVGILFYQISSAANVSRNPRSFIANVDQPTSARSRQIVGAIAGLTGGIVAWRTLGNRELGFDQAAGILLFLAGFASLGSVWFQVTAPIRGRDVHQRLPIPTIEEVRRVLHTAGIRRYLFIRFFFGLGTFADCFLIIYGMSVLKLNLWYIGAAMVALVLAQIVGGTIWTFFGDMPGSRSSIQLAAAMRFGALTLAIAIPFFGASTWYRDTIGNPALASWSFVAVFFLLGLAQNTYTRNDQHYAMRRVRDGKLFPAVDLVLNGMLAVTALTPILGVVMIRMTSLRIAIAVATGIAFVAFMSTAFLQARKRLPRRALNPDLHGPVRPVKERAARTGSIRIRRVKK